MDEKERIRERGKTVHLRGKDKKDMVFARCKARGYIIIYVSSRSLGRTPCPVEYGNTLCSAGDKCDNNIIDIRMASSVMWTI